jgi:hypothetical protein
VPQTPWCQLQSVPAPQSNSKPSWTLFLRADSDISVLNLVGPDDDLKWVETCRPNECNNTIKKGCVWLIHNLIYMYQISQLLQGSFGSEFQQNSLSHVLINGSLVIRRGILAL